ncbi:hypothetical protein GYMLUDRAFT_72560 [Collybiopsis luxurians FD-317 M1]|uniref:Uncharacterized protein n=1 Tax=Collybiopsis luxurians FD-317 M1 TaxID=944289 RepID=A0A0D0CJA6_9AGAR|nr:hypothetical protein GYMLUDRAFT_72560 [Collybiopsis luxurians FD-317 M1]
MCAFPLYLKFQPAKLLPQTIQTTQVPPRPSPLISIDADSNSQANPTLTQVELKNQEALCKIVALHPGDSVPDLTSFAVIEAAEDLLNENKADISLLVRDVENIEDVLYQALAQKKELDEQQEELMRKQKKVTAVIESVSARLASIKGNIGGK